MASKSKKTRVELVDGRDVMIDGHLVGQVTKIRDKSWRAERGDLGMFGLFKTRTAAVDAIAEHGLAATEIPDLPDPGPGPGCGPVGGNPVNAPDADPVDNETGADNIQADADVVPDTQEGDEPGTDSAEASDESQPDDGVSPADSFIAAPPPMTRMGLKVYRAALGLAGRDGAVALEDVAKDLDESLYIVEGAFKYLAAMELATSDYGEEMLPRFEDQQWTLTAADGSDLWVVREKMRIKAMRRPRRTRQPRERDSRLPEPGTVVQGKYKGETYEATVHESDVEYAGERFGTLSAVGRQITGKACNGYRFFNLG